jgi:hypothetical protein
MTLDPGTAAPTRLRKPLKPDPNDRRCPPGYPSQARYEGINHPALVKTAA